MFGRANNQCRSSPGTQWVQIDLQDTYDIHGVLLWHYHGESRVYHDVVVQLSDDPDFMKNARTVYNNDRDNSSGLGSGKDQEYYESAQGGWIPIKAHIARFVRLYSRGNTSDPQNQYIEVEVWATPNTKPQTMAPLFTPLKASSPTVSDS